MKLKKMLAALTSAALAVSTMAFTPLTASAADTVDAPVGTESVLTELSMQDASGTTSPWGGTYVSCWDSEVASWNSDSEVYVKLTVSSVDDFTGDGGSVTSFGDILNWDGLFGWFTFAKIYENQNLNFECSLIPVTGSTSDCATAYLPFSDIKLQTGDDGVSKGVGFNLQAGNCGFTVDSLELVRVSADRTNYASQNVPLVELTGENKNDMKLPGVFDLSKANGPQARLEITFTTNAAWGGMKLLDATDSANVDYENPLTTIQGTDVVGSYTKSIKLSDLGSSEKTIWLNTWSVATIDSVVIYNDETKGDIYTIPVVTVSPDTVEVTADKTAEVVGTSVPLTATITSESGDPINVDYTVDWTVDPAEGATVTGDKTSATLSATKAGEYTVTCTVKAEDGTTYATNTIKVTFTEAIVDADKVTVKAEKDSEKLGTSVKLTADVASTTGKEVTGKYTLDWTVSGEGATVTASEEKDTAVLSATKAGKYTVTCVLKNGEGTEVTKSTADVTFTEPVKPDTVKVTADKETVTEGTPVKFTAAISNSKEEKIDAEYVVEWSVSPDKGAKLNSKENTASLNASEAGEYTVTCTVKSTDGKETYATATAKVKVEAAENPFDLAVEKDELVVGETTTATASRNGEAISVKWTSSDEKIATVDEKGVITAVAKGTVEITATPEDGSPKTVEITVIEATKEYKVEKFVDRLYNTLLGRDPDENSADHKNDLLADKTACDVARNFVLSEEFQNKGLTNEEVVDKMYLTFLGRPADEAGKADWVKRLDNGCSYAHVFYGFTQCKEFAEICADYGIVVGTYKVESPRDVNCNLTAFVTRLYGKVLDRKYDVLGLDNHTAKYLETGDIYAMAYDFIFSPEFVEKKLSDEDFVEIMYNTFFDRASDPEGKANWLKLLAEGGTREDVLKGFVGSNECAELVESFKI